jgi:hypothetical protein
MFSSACKWICKEFRQPGRHGVSMTMVLLRLGDTDMMPCVLSMCAAALILCMCTPKAGFESDKSSRALTCSMDRSFV